MSEPKSQASKPSLSQDYLLLCALVCEGIELFKNYQLSNCVGVYVRRSRGNSRYGIWASVQGSNGFKQTLLARLWGSKATGELYRLSLYQPRFDRLKPREKLETLVHEIYHMHPSLDGRLRTFPGRHRYHGPTPAHYRKRVQALTQELLKNFPSLLQHPLICNHSQYHYHSSDESSQEAVL